MFSFIKRLYSKLNYRWARTSPKRYIAYLRRKGCKIGKAPFFLNGVRTISIDITRPSLIEIGNNVTISKNCKLISHDFTTDIFRKVYHEFIPSSGKIKIGNNVFLGRNCTVLKGVEIGDNSIIGYGSLVTKSIPDNSVAVGVPARVICSLDEYYQKRKKQCVEEAFAYARSIQEYYGRRPVASDFWEEFPLFVSGDEIDLYPTIPIKKQLGSAYEEWRKNHKALFHGLDEFLDNAFCNQKKDI